MNDEWRMKKKVSKNYQIKNFLIIKLLSRASEKGHILNLSLFTFWAQLCKSETLLSLIPKRKLLLINFFILNLKTLHYLLSSISTDDDIRSLKKGEWLLRVPSWSYSCPKNLPSSHKVRNQLFPLIIKS